MLQGLLSLGPSVLPVIFTDDPFYLSICQQNTSLMCISEFETNQYGLPYIRSFMAKLDTLDCDYYGYVNGDILLSHTLLDVLQHLQQNKDVNSKQLIVGRRTNYPWMNITQFPPTNEEYETLLHSICSSDAPYMSNAVVGFLGISQARIISSTLDRHMIIII